MNWFVGFELLLGIIVALITFATVRKPIFWVIQFLSINMEIVGWVVCLSPALAKVSWIYWNDDDGAVGDTWWKRYLWLAWRNPVDNFKHVRWTQAPGPLVYKTWMWRGKQYYYKAGWMSDTYCALSFGSGRGY